MEKSPAYLAEEGRETGVKRSTDELAKKKTPWKTPNITKIGESDVNGAKGIKGIESYVHNNSGPS
jgi:hypothetical protein